MKSWLLTFVTQMLFRRSGSELFDTFKNIFSSEYFHYKIFIHEKMLRKLKWQIPREPIAARCNWCQGPVPDRGPAVEKHCYRLSILSRNIVLILTLSNIFLPDTILLCNILFCFLVRTRQHVVWYWCCLCGHWYSLVFNKRKESPLDQRVVQTKTTIHTRKSHERCNVEWAKRLHKNCLCDSTVQNLMGYWRLTSTVAKE